MLLLKRGERNLLVIFARYGYVHTRAFIALSGKTPSAEVVLLDSITRARAARHMKAAQEYTRGPTYDSLRRTVPPKKHG